MLSIFSKWFGYKKSAKKNTKVTRLKDISRLPRVEILEDRTTPAVANLVGGVLTIDFQTVDSTTEAVVATNDGTSITLTGDVTGAQLSFLIGDVNQLVVGDSGAGTSQSMKFEGTSEFLLTGGVSASGIESIEVKNGISTGTSDINLQANHSLQISASLTTTLGDIILTTTGGASANQMGLVVSGATVVVSTAGGDITLNGTASGTTNNLHGVVVDTGAKILSGDDGTTFGSINITGQGSTLATGNYNFGVWLDGTNTTIQTTGGNISMTGTGGGTGSSGGNFGTVISAAASVQAGGAGTVQLTGHGNATSTGGGNMGVRVEGVGTKVTTAGGDISVQGTGGGTGSGGYNHGVIVVDGGVIQSGGTGLLQVTGVGGVNDKGANNYGVFVSSNYARITSSGGSIQVTGTGGGSGSGSYNYGVKVAATGNITSGTDGNVTIIGTAGGSATSSTGFNIGVLAIDSGMLLAQGTGSLSVTGNGGPNSGGNYNHGVLIGYSSLVQAGSGGITITGTKTNGSTSFGIGMDQNVSATTANTGGSISLIANGLFLGTGATVKTTGSTIVTSSTNITGTGDIIANSLAISAATGLDVDTQVTTLASVSSTTGDITIDQTGNLELPAINATGNLTVVASGSVTQKASTALTVAGNTSITAGTSIQLNASANDFTGAVALKNTGANNVSIVDANAIVLGASSLGSGSFSVQADGISQSGAIVQESKAGPTSLNAGNGILTLFLGGNDFTGAVSLSNSGSGVIQIADANQLLLDNIVAGGGFTAYAMSAISSTSAGSMQAGSNINLTGSSLGTNDQPLVIASASGVNAETTADGGIFLKAMSNPIGLNLVDAGEGTITLKGGDFVSQGDHVFQDTSSVNLDGGAWNLDGHLETVAAILGGSNLQLGAGTLTLNGSSADTYAGVISGTGALVRAGSGSTTLQGSNTYTGTTTISGGMVVLAANQSGNYLVDGGSLQGSATIGNLEVRVGSVSPGVISGKDITLSANAVVHLNIHGSTVDQLLAAGTVNLANAVLNISAISQASAGSELILVNNDGTDAVVGTFQGITNQQLVNIQGVNYRIRYDGGDGNDVSITRPRAEAITVGNVPTSTGSGIEIRNAGNASPATITPFAGFYGEIRVSSNADFDGDGVNEIIVAAGAGGGPRVTVFNGNGGRVMVDFFAYDISFTGGIFVATGDVTGDGVADLVTGAGAGGGPHVMVWDGVSLANHVPAVRASFFAYSTDFRGGVTVATGDLGGDGVDELITGAGVGGGPQINVYSGGSLNLQAAFFAYETDFLGGVFVATGDLDGDLQREIITGQGAGGNARVNYFSGQNYQRLGSFLAYGQSFTGSVRVGAADYYGTGIQNLITGAGAGGGPQVNVYDSNNNVVDSFFGANDPSFTRGIYVS